MLPAPESTLVSRPDSEKRNTSKRVPRPPNAFMLYRSDFLKRRAVPPEVEKRQQNLSRIAGQCWNILPDSEKEYWYNQASIVRAEHRARHPFYKVGSLHPVTKEPSIKARRGGSATTSRRSVGSTRNRQTKSPYCESMFAALHGSTFSSPASQPDLPFLTPPSVSPLSTAASLSPVQSSQLTSPFASPAHTSRQLEHSPSSDTQQLGLSHMDVVSPEVSPSQELCRSLQQCEDNFASPMPYTDLEQLSKLMNDPASQPPLTLSQSDAFSYIGYPLMDYGPLANGFGSIDALAFFNPSLVPSYPLFDGELNAYGCGGS